MHLLCQFRDLKLLHILTRSMFMDCTVIVLLPDELLLDPFALKFRQK